MNRPARPGWYWIVIGQAFFIRQMVDTKAFDAVYHWLWDNRQSSNVAAGLVFCLVGRLVRDVKYFKDVPEEDIRRFVEEPASQAALFHKRKTEDR